MDKPKLQIKPKKYTEESTIMSMRIPKDMIRDLDAVANLLAAFAKTYGRETQ